MLVLSSTAFCFTEPPKWLFPFPSQERYAFEVRQAPANAVEDFGRYASLAEKITDEERALTALVIYHESRGESRDGQKAVCEVVFNRWLDPRFPDTIKEIIYAKGQFAVASYLTTASIKEPACLAVAFDIVDEVLQETEYILPSEDYVYFATTVIGKAAKPIGNHYFCK